MSELVYIGLGSNLNEPSRQIANAVKALRSLGDVTAVSSLYRTPPMGSSDQPDYVNAVVALNTTLAPLALLSHTQAIEQRQGRMRQGARWGARTLDLDILLYGDQELMLPELTVPHYGMADRIFVIKPLMEIAPDLKIPKLGQITVIYDSISEQPIERIDANE